MNFIQSIFCKILIYIDNKKLEYIFNRSRNVYVSNWGVGTYGFPSITCYDNASRLSVGKYTSIASNVSILLGSNHKRGLLTNYPRLLINNKIKPEDTNERGDVVIGNDVWIGFGVTIIGPVVIGDGAIIGAGAVVVRDIPSYAVAVGVPATVVKYRFTEKQIEELLKIKWWNKEVKSIKDMEIDLYSKNIINFISTYRTNTDSSGIFLKN